MKPTLPSVTSSGKAPFLQYGKPSRFKNEFGLDLFQYKGAIYEGRTGLCLCNLQQSQDLSGFMERHGGLESIEKQITNSLGRTGLSPRYTRPNEKKKGYIPAKGEG